MEFDYFDFIGCEDSCLATLFGIIFSPVLFPIYLVLQIITIILEVLGDYISFVVEDIKESAMKRKEENNKSATIEEVNTMEIDNTKKEELENKLAELKEQKNYLENYKKELETKNTMKEENNLDKEKVEEKEETMTLQLKY